ncbi:adenylate kinase 8 [Xenentodon cancila]
MDEMMKKVRIPPHMVAYAEKHDVFKLMQSLLTSLIIDRPEDPISYLIRLLRRPSMTVPRIMLLGPPAVGKNTVAKRLSAELNAVLVTMESLQLDQSELSTQQRRDGCVRDHLMDRDGTGCVRDHLGDRNGTGCVRDHLGDRDGTGCVRDHLGDRDGTGCVRDHLGDRDGTGCVRDHLGDRDGTGCVRDHLGDRDRRGCVRDHLGDRDRTGCVRDHLGDRDRRGCVRDHLGDRDGTGCVRDHLGDRDGTACVRDHLGDRDGTGCVRDHLGDRDGTGCVRDHLGDRDGTGCVRDHLGDRDGTGCVRDHLGDRDGTGCVRDHLGDRDGTACVRDHLGDRDGPACVRDHLGDRDGTGCVRDHLGDRDGTGCVRDHLEDRDCAGVPIELLVQQVQQRLKEPDCFDQGWLLEGIPQTRLQALALQRAGVLPEHVVMLEAPETVLLDRNQGRLVDPQTGDIYHRTFIWPADNGVAERLIRGQNLSKEQLLAQLQRYRCEVTGLRLAYQHALKAVDSNQPHNDVFQDVLAFVQTHGGSRITTPKILLLGPPGSGKSHQAALLSEKHKMVDVCCDQVLKSVTAGGSSLGHKVQFYLDHGSPVPDVLVLQVLEERLSHLDCSCRGWVLHAFPCDLQLARSLQESPYRPNRVFFLDATDDICLERVTLRATDPVTGQRFHTVSQPASSSKVQDRLQTRPEDRTDTVAQRLHQYRTNVAVLKMGLTSIPSRIHSLSVWL